MPSSFVAPRRLWCTESSGRPPRDLQQAFWQHRRSVSPRLILSLQDQHANGLLVESTLGRVGHTVTAFAEPEAALDYLADFEVDLLIIDMHLRRMQGTTFLQHVRMMEAGRRHRTPALFFAGARGSMVEQEIQLAGGQGFMFKPLRILDLLDAVEALVRPVEPAEPPVAADVSQLQLLRESGMDAEFIAEYVQQSHVGLAMLRQRLEAAVFTRDPEPWRETCTAISTAAADIEAHAVAQVATKSGAAATAQSAPRLAALRQIDAALEQLARQKACTSTA